MSTTSQRILKLSCPDRVGVVANVITCLAAGANVMEAQHFRDALANRSTAPCSGTVSTGYSSSATAR